MMRCGAGDGAAVASRESRQPPVICFAPAWRDKDARPSPICAPFASVVP
jgi:hypothetical protein